MKTTKRFIVLFLLSLIFQSCENESTVNETPNNQQPNNSENYDYEFNEDNLLIGQTQTSISTQSNTVYVIEITYQYE